VQCYGSTCQCIFHTGRRIAHGWTAVTDGLLTIMDTLGFRPSQNPMDHKPNYSAAFLPACPSETLQGPTPSFTPAIRMSLQAYRHNLGRIKGIYTRDMPLRAASLFSLQRCKQTEAH
jgi:hypothetical protein